MSNNIVYTHHTKSNNKVITSLKKKNNYLQNTLFSLFLAKKTYKVITHFSPSCASHFLPPLKTKLLHCNYKIIFHLFSKCYKKHFTHYSKSNYKVLTRNLKCYYIVITSLFFTFSLRAYAQTPPATPTDILTLYTPITEASLIYGHIQQPADLLYNTQKIHIDKNGNFVLALPQDAPDTLTLTTISGNQSYDWTYQVTKRTWKEEKVNGLPPQKVSPSEENKKRILQENTLLKNKRKQSFYTQLPMCFSRPVEKNARISSHFGSRRVLNGIKTTGHSGTDYALPIGTPIYAPADGIIKVIHQDMFYSGKTILIDHGFGVYSSYSHLNHISVNQDTSVKRGEKIGEIGTTGRSTGPHLHFTMTWFGVRIDPEYVLTHYACDK